MSRKSVKRRAVHAVDEPHGGIVAGIIDRAFENPATSGGLMVMALTATAIVSNAMFLQNGRHPDPLFGFTTAPFADVGDVSAVGTLSAEDGIAGIIPPLPHLSPASAQAPLVIGPELADKMLVADVQRELARLGLYSGAIDGIAGSRTSAAISAYEAAAGFQPTGTASAELLRAMRTPLRQPQPAVTPAPDLAPTGEELDRREQERAAKIAADQEALVDARARANAKLVQDALNRAGYGPIPVDGQAGTVTANAIRRFELDNGMPISGKISDQLMGRLMSIGALKAI